MLWVLKLNCVAFNFKWKLSEELYYLDSSFIKISESCFLESLLLVSVEDDHFFDCVRWPPWADHEELCIGEADFSRLFNIIISNQ